MLFDMGIPFGKSAQPLQTDRPAAAMPSAAETDFIAALFFRQKPRKIRDLTSKIWHCFCFKSEVCQMVTTLIGYRRSSCSDQIAGYEAQHAQLAATGCTKIFGEMVSSVAQRDQLDAALDYVREGDTLVVCKIDRLARSTADLLAIIAKLEAKGVALRILDFGGSAVDTKSPTGRMLLTMFAAVAEFERSVMLERQRIGIARAKAEGRYHGRAPTARRLAPQVRELLASGIGPTAIAARLNISRASVHRIIAENDA